MTVKAQISYYGQDAELLVIGVDVSTTRVALADNTGRMDSVSIRSGKDGPSLFGVAHQVGIFAHQFVNGRQVAAVIIETPMGKVPSPALMMTVGVVTCAVYGQLRRDGQAVLVEPINISTWKKSSVGHGNASKDQVMDWVLNRGIKPANQDEADAYCVAVAGERLIIPVAA